MGCDGCSLLLVATDSTVRNNRGASYKSPILLAASRDYSVTRQCGPGINGKPGASRLPTHFGFEQEPGDLWSEFEEECALQWESAYEDYELNYE